MSLRQLLTEVLDSVFIFYFFYFFVSVLMFHIKEEVYGRLFPERLVRSWGLCVVDLTASELTCILDKEKKQAQIWTREKAFCLLCLRVQRSVRQASLALNPSVPPELKLQTAEESRDLSSCPAAPDFFKKTLFPTQELPWFFVGPPFISLLASLEYVYSG